VAANEIEPHYQPFIELSDGRLLGFEILARWQHPDKGLVAPDVFTPVIERLGLMPEFTLAMLQACIDAQEWPADLRLSLNVSPRELTDLLFPYGCLACFRKLASHRTGLRLKSRRTLSLRTWRQRRRSFIRSRMSESRSRSRIRHRLLQPLSPARTKARQDQDRSSFIQSIKDNPEGAKIVYGILGLAKSLALPTTAEGIEDAEILDRLNEAGCEIGQGYHFGKAMPAAEVSKFVRKPHGKGKLLVA
jgi:EAL domain-containing protein (putative c-di-GMP-specific phosphodiesterase class I)